MNRYLLIRRLSGPAFLILTGVLALLNEVHVLPWHKSWPLYLILWGLLKLAQRMALSDIDVEGYPGYPDGYPPAPGAGPSAPPAPSASGMATTAIIPAPDSGPEAHEWRP